MKKYGVILNKKKSNQEGIMKSFQPNVICYYYQQINLSENLFADMFNDNYALWLASNDSDWDISQISE